jgi:uncharacterized protein (TIGR02646 family)
MRKWNRPKAPRELRDRKRELTRKFINECQRLGRTADCHWPDVTTPEGTSETLPAHFRRITQNHCTYCDSFMGHPARSTIDHFLPKKHFPKLTYAWSNLYHSCDGCQRKGQRYDKEALRPDAPGYRFKRYFCYSITGHLLVIAQDKGDRKRAEATIELFQLNCPELVRDRSLVFHHAIASHLHPVQLRLATDLHGADLSSPLGIDARPYRDWHG